MYLPYWCIARIPKQSCNRNPLKSVTKHLKKGILNCYRTPELANKAIQNLWKHFDPVVHKRRCTFIKSLFNTV
jgi:hypothetical protein